MDLSQISKLFFIVVLMALEDALELLFYPRFLLKTIVPCNISSHLEFLQIFIQNIFLFNFLLCLAFLG